MINLSLCWVHQLTINEQQAAAPKEAEKYVL